MTTVPIDGDKPVWILQGSFGRATVNFISRPLVAHAHSQYQFLFKLGGSNCNFRIGADDCALTAERAICLNPWVEHSKSSSADEPSLILSLVIEARWLRQQLKLAESGTAAGRAAPRGSHRRSDHQPPGGPGRRLHAHSCGSGDRTRSRLRRSCADGRDHIVRQTDRLSHPQSGGFHQACVGDESHRRAGGSPSRTIQVEILSAISPMHGHFTAALYRLGPYVACDPAAWG